MLNPSDDLLIARDQAVPGLRVLLDDVCLLASLGESFPEFRLVGAHAEYLRYKPGVSCLARLRLQTAAESLFAYAVAYHRDARDKLAKAAEFCDENGRRPVVLCADSIVVYPFPLDRRLPALARFATPSSIHDLLKRAAPEVLQGLSPDQDIELITLRYKPERRYVAKLATAGQPFAALKMYSDDSFDSAKRAAKIIGVDRGISHALWAGHSDRHAAIIFKWVHGESLPEQLTNNDVADQLIRCSARTLLALHSLVRTKLAKGLLSEGLRRAQDSVRVLELIDEPSGDDARIIADAVGNYLCEMAPFPVVPIHGDLHLKQFLVGSEGVKLIDFDRSRMGDPAEDIGNLYADLMRRSISAPATINFGSLFECFLDEYRKASGEVDLHRVYLYATIRLLELATEPFRSRQLEWLAHTRPLITAASRTFAKLTNGGVVSKNTLPKRCRTHVVTVDDPFGIITDDALPNGNEAIEPRIAELRLREAVYMKGTTIDIALDSIRVLRHKRGRRCLIEYRGRLKHNNVVVRVFGKVHAAARHSKSLARQQALWDAGFHTECDDGIHVALPLGVIPEWHMWLQLGVPGEPAWKSLEGPLAAKTGCRIAEAAHKLHVGNVPASHTHSIQDELNLLYEQLPQVADELPELRHQLHDILEECRKRAQVIDELTPVGIHRDFYPDQVLIYGGQMYVVDHDWYVMGDPRLDIGNFIGHLIERSLRVAGHPRVYDEAAGAIIERFLTLNGKSEKWRETIGTYTMLTVVRHVYLSRRFPERRETTSKLVDQLQHFEDLAPLPFH